MILENLENDLFYEFKCLKLKLTQNHGCLKRFLRPYIFFYIIIYPSNKIIQFANAYIINRLKNAHNQICKINNSI